MKFAFIHIRKAGGTALKHVFRSALKGHDDASPVRLYEHQMTLEKLWASRPEQHAIFIVRDPVDRFISGFNGRLRQGKPTFDTPWNEEEAIAFGMFKKPNQLAEALSSGNRWKKAAAEFAMLGIRHTRYPLSFWLKDAEFLEENQHRIAFVGLLPELESDLPHILRTVGLPDDRALPTSRVRANVAPKLWNREISELGRRNVEEWYKDDYPILRWCEQWRAKHLPSPAGDTEAGSGTAAQQGPSQPASQSPSRGQQERP